MKPELRRRLLFHIAPHKRKRHDSEPRTRQCCYRVGAVDFYVSDVDRFWAYLIEKGFHLDSPQDASWGERYFHMADPDGHELSFARPF